ncbi:MAG TPA: hypothetical protein VIQ81_07055 [Gammaproteobacteria bacterium]
MKKTLCPFSKPIIGNWCQCQHANLDERCAGKMTCLQAHEHLAGCYALVDTFREKSRFVLGLSHADSELTHMQLMKIRCGGLQGMQRILEESEDCSVPDVLQLIQLAEQRYGRVDDFPFNEIVCDIQNFSHRAKKRG